MRLERRLEEGDTMWYNLSQEYCTPGLIAPTKMSAESHFETSYIPVAHPTPAYSWPTRFHTRSKQRGGFRSFSSSVASENYT